VNLRTLQASEMRVLEQANAAANTAVSEAIRNHANILNREIRTNSLDLSPDGSTEKNINMNSHRIIGLKDADPETESEAANLRTLNRKIQSQTEINNQLESLKYLWLDGENQMVSNFQMNGHKIIEMADSTAATDGVNLRNLDATFQSLASENYANGLILTTNENIFLE